MWHFYVENPRSQFPYRAHFRTQYIGRRVDFLKRSIPRPFAKSRTAGESILCYLLERDTKTKRKLLIKAVVGLYPKPIFGRVLWRGTL